MTSLEIGAIVVGCSMLYVFVAGVVWVFVKDKDGDPSSRFYMMAQPAVGLWPVLLLALILSPAFSAPRWLFRAPSRIAKSIKSRRDAARLPRAKQVSK